MKIFDFLLVFTDFSQYYFDIWTKKISKNFFGGVLILIFFWQIVDDFCLLAPDPQCEFGSRRSPIMRIRIHITDFNSNEIHTQKFKLLLEPRASPL